MFEHVVDENRPAECQVVGVVEGDVVMELSIPQIEIQDRSTASAAERIRRSAETLFPFVKASESR